MPQILSTATSWAATRAKDEISSFYNMAQHAVPGRQRPPRRRRRRAAADRLARAGLAYPARGILLAMPSTRSRGAGREALFVRIPTGEAQRLDSRRLRAEVSKQDIVSALVARYVDPASPASMEALRSLDGRRQRFCARAGARGRDALARPHDFRPTCARCSPSPTRPSCCRSRPT